MPVQCAKRCWTAQLAAFQGGAAPRWAAAQDLTTIGGSFWGSSNCFVSVCDNEHPKSRPASRAVAKHALMCETALIKTQWNGAHVDLLYSHSGTFPLSTVLSMLTAHSGRYPVSLVIINGVAGEAL